MSLAAWTALFSAAEDETSAQSLQAQAKPDGRLLPEAATVGSGNKASIGGGEIKLIMFEQWGCEYCERWEEEVGQYYGNTSEAKFAPLERADYRDARKQYKIRGVVYTPTFVVIRGGKEQGRITGYPGEDFFWELLGQILKPIGFSDTPPAKSAEQGAMPKTPAQ